MSHLITSMEFKDLSFGFEGQDLLLENTNLNIPMGEIVSLKGERGAGRSTMLQILAGLQMPIRGEFNINDRNVLEMSFEEFLPYRLKIGYTFDLGGLMSNKTLQDNLLLPLIYHRILPEAEAKERVFYYINKFSFMKSKDMRPANVSGGLRKLTCLLRSLLLEPEVLLLDDLTVGLSKPLVDLFCECIYDLRKAGKNHTVVFSSYDEEFVRKIETSSVGLEGGQTFLQQVDKKVVSL